MTDELKPAPQVPETKQCEAGCMGFEGGERKHTEGCVFYPESLTKMYAEKDARIAELEARMGKLFALNEGLIGQLHIEQTTAHNEAFTKAAKIAYGVNNHDNPMTANDVGDEIMALKTEQAK